MREREIERRLFSKVKTQGGLACKFVSPGMRGMPDRVVLYKTKVAFVELKAPGEVPEPLQSKRRRQLEAQGFDVYTLDSLEAVDAFIGDFCK